MRVTFGYSTSQRLLSKLIRLLIGQPASHAYIRYEDPWGEEVVLESVFPVVMERPAQVALKGKTIIDEIELEVPDSRLKCARALRGKWYDFANIFMFLGMIALSWVSITWRGWKSNPYHQICSDIQLKALGWDGEEKTTPWDIRLKINKTIQSGGLKVYK